MTTPLARSPTSGTIIVAGVTTSQLPDQVHVGDADAFVRKYDSAGNSSWTRQFGSTSIDMVADIGVDTSGNIVAVGITMGELSGQASSGSLDGFVRKFDATGSEAWTRQFGTADPDGLSGVVVDGTGNIVVVGFSSGALPGETTSGGQDAIIRKLDSSGTILWTRQFGTAGNDVATRVTLDASSNALVAGYTEGVLSGQANAGMKDAFVRKYDPNGALLWTRQFGTAADDKALQAIVDVHDALYLLGETAGPLSGQSSTGYSDVFVQKYDSTGNHLWTRLVGTASADAAGGIALDASGNILVVGSIVGALPGLTSAGGKDFFVRKYDPAGNILWTRQHGTSGDELVANGIAVLDSGNFVVVGNTNGVLPGQGSAGQHDAFVIQFSP